MKITSLTMVVVGVFYFSQSYSGEMTRSAEHQKAVGSQIAQLNKEEQALDVKCTTGISTVVADARISMRAGDPNAAFNLLNECRNKMTNPDAKALHVQAMNAARKKDDSAAQKVRAAKKREGVGIGMTEQEVIDSAWGRPRKINRTTTSHGQTEQWVYNGNYLYFTDGVLTAIQN